MRTPDRPVPANKGHQDLLVWQYAMDLVVAVYRLSKTFPSDEKYSLVQQIRRAAVSIPSNIAEGRGRHHLGDYLRHLSIARGSVMEVETQLLIAGRMGYASGAGLEQILDLTARVGRMLSGLLRALRKHYHVPSTQHPAPSTKDPAPSTLHIPSTSS